jgi:hypothetical protein
MTVLLAYTLPTAVSSLRNMFSVPYSIDREQNLSVSFPDAGTITLSRVIDTANPNNSFDSLPFTSMIATRPIWNYRSPLEQDEYRGYRKLSRYVGAHSLCCYAEPEDGVAPFALKMAIDIDINDPQAEVAERLINEANFYASNLQEDQGRSVPIHYGLWSGEASWCGKIMVAILEWCGVSWGTLIGSQFDTIERRCVSFTDAMCLIPTLAPLLL